MSHEVESMFSVREVPWHYEMTKDATKIIQTAPNSREALIAAGLDWKVTGKKIYTAENIEISGYRANTRSTDDKVLGIVSDRYCIVQNVEAFSFTDKLIGSGARYETAGSLRGGKQVWMLAKTDQIEILGDKVDPYICFTNSHDGLGSVRCMMTPIRVVCNNTLNLALNTASRAWSTRHIGNLDEKLSEAERTLFLADQYMSNLAKTADQLANTSVTDDDVRKLVDGLFPLKEDATERMRKNTQELQDDFICCYLAPDILKFRNTAWGVINAASDMATHSKPKRITDKSDENRWSNIMNGNILVDKTFLMLSQLAKISK